MPARPRLLDLFCGAGGAAVGYHRAGFDIIGVDIEDQPNYPFRFVRSDWEEALALIGPGVDVVHASPPCQGYSRMRHLPWLAGKQYPLLIDAVRGRLEMWGGRWVIENVEDSPMPCSTVLCGQTFGIPFYRHRRFGSSELILAPPHQTHRHTISPGHMLGDKGRISTWERQTRLPEAMGCEWMTQKEVSQAVPPCYTEWIGKALCGG